METNNLKIALQRSGRLADDSLKLLRNCGIRLGNGAGKLRTAAGNFPLEVFFLRDDDIPEYVADGVADVGIVGENVLAEKSSSVRIVERLGFGRCRLAVAVPKTGDLRSVGELTGRRVATSYPNVLGRFLAENGIRAEIHTISGSVEIAPSIGLADAICDLVSTGSTLFSNGLREVATVMESEATLFSRARLSPDLDRLVEKLVFRIRAVRSARANKYILLNAPDAKLERIIGLIPGMKSPTVMPLAETGWSSVHSVINENDFWEVVENLKNEGAEGILVLSIDQMIK
jgi:ATP phosphoribosyltransferase